MPQNNQKFKRRCFNDLDSRFESWKQMSRCMPLLELTNSVYYLGYFEEKKVSTKFQ